MCKCKCKVQVQTHLPQGAGHAGARGEEAGGPHRLCGHRQAARQHADGEDLVNHAALRACMVCVGACGRGRVRKGVRALAVFSVCLSVSVCMCVRACVHTHACPLGGQRGGPASLWPGQAAGTAQGPTSGSCFCIPSTCSTAALCPPINPVFAFTAAPCPPAGRVSRAAPSAAPRPGRPAQGTPCPPPRAA